VGAGDPPSTILIDVVPVEGVEEFIYLGSKQSSNGYGQPDVLRRIGLACSVMNSLQMVWKCSSLSISTKVHLYQVLVMSVLLYGAEMWIHLFADMNILEAFHIRCQRQILNIRWWTRRVARLDPGVPAHDALHLMVDTYKCRKPMASWRRPLGRPHNVWLNKVQEDANALPLSTLWRSEIARGHGAAQRSTRTTQQR